MITRGKNIIHKPIQKLSLTAQIPGMNHTEPTCISQGLKDKNWHKACSDQCNALVHNSTWEPVSPHTSQNLVSYKWIFRIKKYSNGSIEKYKASVLELIMQKLLVRLLKQPQSG